MSIDLEIQKKLSELESKHSFQILFAAEAGSRAWGFASTDSDYDVRFVYAWPRDQYLSIELPGETIDHAIDENDIDLSGWELRKALSLFRKSNGALLEWLFSPIIYRAHDELLNTWRNLVTLDGQFVAKRSAAHYLGLSKGMWQRIQNEPSKITAKKYLYLMRSLLAARFVVTERKRPPVLFSELMDQLSLGKTLTLALEQMVAQKAYQKESDAFGPVSTFDEFVVNEIPHLESVVDEMSGELLSLEKLDPFFNDVLERTTAT